MVINLSVPTRCLDEICIDDFGRVARVRMKGSNLKIDGGNPSRRIEACTWPSFAEEKLYGFYYLF